MGMTSDQNENLSFKEQLEIAKKEQEAAQRQKNQPVFTRVGVVELDSKKYVLYCNDADKTWHKAEIIGTDRADNMNKTPLFTKCNEMTPVTKQEAEKIFGKVKN